MENKNKIIIPAYGEIVSLENIFKTFLRFISDKKNKDDVALFKLNAISNINDLHMRLKNKNYKHSSYTHFKINDPKLRDIHKAIIEDRLIHNIIYDALYPYYDRKFIYDSYSSRVQKGQHKAVDRFRDFSRKVSRNNKKTCLVLKCDIRKCFASIDHDILKQILKKSINDIDILKLLENIIDSFETKSGIGLPLGNLTSQLLVNIYMNEFDQYLKHKLQVKYYIRYADDFVILSESKEYLKSI